MSRKADTLTDFDKQLIASMEEAVASAIDAPNKCRETVVKVNVINVTEGHKLRPLDDVLLDVFTHAIEFCDGNKSQAADGLGIGRTTLYRKMGVLRQLLSQEGET